MAQTPVRWEVIKTLKGLFIARPEMEGCQVETGWPGEQALTGTEVLYLDMVVSSEVDVPTMRSGAKDQDDTFDLHWVTFVRGRTDHDEAMERLCEIDAAIHRVIVGDPSLGDLDGNVSAEITERNQKAPRTPSDGLLGHGLTVIQVHTRLSPS